MNEATPEDLSRRKLLLAGSSLLTCSCPATASSKNDIRIGLTPVFLNRRSGFLQRWQKYLEKTIDRPVMFVQRRSYADVLELLMDEQLTAAWLCGYPYVRYQKSLALIAVPRYQGAPLYSAYIITGPSTTGVTHFEGLRSKVFAYSDPLSNSGFLYAKEQLQFIKEKDVDFFRKSFFTFGHQNVIAAVSEGLADAGSVDGYVWDSLASMSPELTQGTRILMRSGKFGFPPFVAHVNSPESDKQLIRRALLGMENNQEGQLLLRELNLDGFIKGHPSLYDGISTMMKRAHV
jgi:phosphonate transport system substrate-binding protein